MTEAAARSHIQRKEASSWRSYPAYKDSVEWQGKIPTHWELKRLRFACAVNPSKAELSRLPVSTEVSFLPMEAISEDGRLDLEQTRRLDQVWQGYTNFQDMDVIVAKITPCFENGKGALCVGLLGGVGFGTTELEVLRPNENIYSPFIFYLTKSHPFRNLGIASMKGVAGQQRITEDFVKDFRISIPPYPEQQTIAAFLDIETGKIDALMAKKARLIELLQEKRAALISHAVTKGLNPNVLMKDSSVDWLPRIPAHWEVKRNGNLFRERDERGFPELPLLNVSISTGVSLREFSTERIEQKAEDPATYKRAKTGDIAFNKMRMWQGAVGVAPVDGLVSPDYIVAKPLDSVDPRYFEHLFRTEQYKTEVNRYSHGIVDDRNRLYWEGFKQIKSVVPSQPEQREIVHWIDEGCSKLDALIAKVREGIEKLKEYRTALISAAVTGKIDVRDG